MATASKAGALYAVAAFLIGFILGTIRVLLVVPRLGETAAVLLIVQKNAVRAFHSVQYRFGIVVEVSRFRCLHHRLNIEMQGDPQVDLVRVEELVRKFSLDRLSESSPLSAAIPVRDWSEPKSMLPIAEHRVQTRVRSLSLVLERVLARHCIFLSARVWSRSISVNMIIAEGRATQ
jgi:hypothetical protein